MHGSGETVLAFPAKFAFITSRDPVRTWTPDGVFLYFSDVLIVPKVPLSLVPTPCTETIIAIAIPAAIKPYSIAVAPDSSLKNARVRDFMVVPNLCLPLQALSHSGTLAHGT